MNSHLFQQLTGYAPFPWQEALYHEWANGIHSARKTLALPTGAGKTSVIAIWLMLLAEHAGKVPRRLVYAVNRRTVVDQTTEEVLKIIENLKGTKIETPLQKMRVIDLPEGESPLAVSTLRGQLADNRAWSADPCRPAVIVGTVDMIGSRLLFGGYRIGFKSRPLHAAFLGQDALIVHDEAHLEPAFQQLLEGIETEQKNHRRGTPTAHPYQFSVIALSATARGNQNETFGITDDDLANEVLSRRMHARKRLFLHSCEDKANVSAEKIADLALQHECSGQPIVIFVRSIEVLNKIKGALTSGKENKAREKRIRTLTGTLRGLERDNLVRDPIFQRFLAKDTSESSETVYLLCTSAGEVGVNLSAKHLACDLSTFESMAQRFGRVNRFGDKRELPENEQTRLDVVFPDVFPEWKKDPEKPSEKRKRDYETARQRTLAILKQLSDASPKSLGDIPATDRAGAFSPEPKILPLTDILLDNWSLTSIRDPMPGRPPVEPYLHGIDEEYDPPRTTVAWREEVDKLSSEILPLYPPETLLEIFPLKPHELLSDVSIRVFAELGKLEKRLEKQNEGSSANAPIWIVDEYGNVTRRTLDELTETKEGQSVIENRTIILPPSIGGLGNDGMLDGNAPAITPTGLDVCEHWLGQDDQKLRKRTWGRLDDETGWKCVLRLDTADRESVPEEEGTTDAGIWHWYEAIWGGDSENGLALRAVPLKNHTSSVEAFAEALAAKLGLNEPLSLVLKLAGRWHDLGKDRDQWQRSIGNRELQPRLAKPGIRMKSMRLSDYRHEFGSLLDLEEVAEFQVLPEETQDLVLHLIAAHHGRARPHFTTAEAIDPEATLSRSRIVRESVPHRFARLQQRHGRWGLAYLESILRGADYAASAERKLQG